MDFETFKHLVNSSGGGLSARRCASSTGHWQICGGDRLVNVWPETKKRGFVMQLDGDESQPGNVGQAIRLARSKPLDGKTEQTLVVQVGLCRTVFGVFWRWFW